MFDGRSPYLRLILRFLIDWLADKETGSPFALPGLYQPLSSIPLISWLASRSSSNGIEQTHRHLNIGGIGHSLLGGIMIGYAHDREALRRREVTVKLGILPRHMVPTKHNKQVWALRRSCTSIPWPILYVTVSTLTSMSPHTQPRYSTSELTAKLRRAIRAHQRRRQGLLTPLRLNLTPITLRHW